MNLPNKLTVMRIFCVPVVVVLLLLGNGGAARTLAGVLFILASVTDLVDGIIARKRNLITNFGKLMDPLADKLLVCSVLVCLVSLDEAPVFAAILILGREFAVDGIRLLAAEKGTVIAAGSLGKRKANFQTFWLITLLFPFDWTPWAVLEKLFMWTALILTAASFVEYIVKYKDVLKDK